MEQASFSESGFIFAHPLRVTVRNVSDIIEQALSHCNLKDAKSGKYLQSSKFELEFSGLTPEEIVGLTTEDIDVGLLKGSKPAKVKLINAMDKKVSLHRSPILHKEIWVTHDGFLRTQNLIKVPIIGHNNKTIAIFSYGEDFTPRLNLFDLFSLYERHYLPGQAIKKFLGYWGVDTCFQEAPTRAEVLTIIALSLDSRHKQAAKLLKIHPKTVACHAFSLRSKLKRNIDLYTVLNKIRNAHRNTCSVEDWLTG